MTNREIDALVAEKVMGFAKSHTPFDFPQQWDMPSRHPDLKHRKEYPRWYKAFQPSSDIADAWLVVEKVAEYDRLGFRIEHLCENSSDRWIAFFPTTCVPDCEEMDPEANRAIADTAPMAICLAALKAVGVGAQEPR